MALNTNQKQEIIKKFGKNTNDSGSTEVQIALLTSEINALASHLEVNKKDFISKRGLMQKVNRRKKLIRYLEQINVEKSRSLRQELKIK